MHRDGRVFPVEVSIAGIDAGGASLVSHFVRDLSEPRGGAKLCSTRRTSC